MIFAIIKKHERNKIVATWKYRPNEFDRIYEKIMELTSNNHEISQDTASWCELAIKGEIYEFAEGEIEIQEIN